ncbi:MAG: adenine phosphoribosyltransferase [Candidatus Micrarchaeota archaeon]|nr:adenine phosphoribosyltransferase [Candidatus Micrarchaeota archaeon]
MDGELEKRIRAKIRDVPDYPKKGILFKDITPLLKDHCTFSACIDALADSFKGEKIDYAAGVEARGFIIGGALAGKLGVGFVPIRKKGKLPYRKVSIDYELEYGKETLEAHEDAVEKGSSVLIVDDLLATGGTARAAADLVQKMGASIIGFGFIVELSELNGRGKLGGQRIVSLIRY